MRRASAGITGYRNARPLSRPAVDQRDPSPRVRAAEQIVSSATEHRVRVQLRWRDMDMLGHLNQSVYHELLEEGRIALIADLMRRAGAEDAHGGYVLAHVDLDYHAEVRKDHGDVDILVRVSRVGTSSVELEHEIVLPGGHVAASGKSVLVAWDLVARTKRTLSERERAALT